MGRQRQQNKNRRWGSLLLRTLAGVLSLALILAATALVAVSKLEGNIESAPLPAPVVTADTAAGAMNILFIGSDSRDLKSSEYGKRDGTQRSDALMLVHLSQGDTRIDAVQIPRDTLLDLPACEDAGRGASTGGPSQMINTALAAGPGCSVRAVEALSDVSIDHFVQLDFDGFSSMVDALGGVRVCLNTALVDPYAKLNLPAGKQNINGKNALALARTRHAVGDGSDIGRLGHQQVVMSAIVKQARSTSILTRPDKLLRFLNAVTKSITVDDQISSITELTGLAKRAQAVPDDKITFVTMPNMPAPTDPYRVVKTKDADVLFKAIAKDRELPVATSDPQAPKHPADPSATQKPASAVPAPVKATARKATDSLCS
jgi:LCP family protein required for cell wall assembly